MSNQIVLSDYQLWLCEQIRKSLADPCFQVDLNAYDSNIGNRELLTFALSEMLFRLQEKAAPNSQILK